MVRRAAYVLALLAAAVAVGCGSDGGGGGGDGGSGGGSGGSDDQTKNWPLFGRIPARTHYLDAKDLDPPLKQVWEFDDKVLLEFPPALVGDRLFVADKLGNVRALRTSDGKVVWEHIRSKKSDSGPPADVTAPTFADGRVIVAFEHGEVAAFDPKEGKRAWSTDLGTRLESSPIAYEKVLLIGTDSGELVALRTSDGKRTFSFKAEAPIKASPSVDQGKSYFGDYQGTMYSVSASSGKREWSTDSTTTPAGGDGGFYSSPAIAGGRVYAGRDDGTVFAFDSGTGKYLWHFKADGKVYGSPAVAPVPGGPLTIFIGSYDAYLYALNAETGKVIWKEKVGPVPGTATVVDRTVYTSSFRTGKTVGFDTKTRKQVFSYPSPGYTPMISDGVRLFLAGYESVHAFEPKSGS